MEGPDTPYRRPHEDWRGACPAGLVQVGGLEEGVGGDDGRGDALGDQVYQLLRGYLKEWCCMLYFAVFRMDVWLVWRMGQFV